MPFRTRMGRRLHELHCPILRGRDENHLIREEYGSFPICSICNAQEGAKECCICGSAEAVVSNAACHEMCVDCISNMVNSNMRSGVEKPLSCFCSSGQEVDFSVLNETLQKRVRSYSSTQAHKVPNWEDVTVNKCPMCNVAYDTFDGCLSLTCTQCKVVFCALCDFVSKDGRAGHNHVLHCKMNPRRGGSYFMSSDEYGAFDLERKRHRMRIFMSNKSAFEQAVVCESSHTIYPEFVMNVNIVSLLMCTMYMVVRRLCGWISLSTYKMQIQCGYAN